MTLNAVSNVAYIALQAYMSEPNSTNVPAINYVSVPTLTCASADSYTANVPANTLPSAPVSVSLLAVFPNLTAPVFMAVYDDTNPGQTFYVGTGAGAQMIEVAAGGFFAVATGGALPSTIYLANPNPTGGVVKIAVMSN